MDTDSNGGLVIHGRSYAFSMDDVDFLTWKHNPDTDDYWVKFHFESKDVRVKICLDNFNVLLRAWKGIEFIPDNYKNGDKYGLDRQR